MALQLGDTAPDFEAETTEGRVRFHDWLGDSWAVLFSHPKDFTPVCTTELGYMASIKPEFDRRGVKVIGLSVDPVDKHGDWARDIEETQGTAPNYPIIADSDFNVSKLYGMLPAGVSGDPAERTPADNQTVRNVFVIGPDKKVKLILVYPMTTGRNFDEVLRVIDSLQLTAKHRVATPAQWQQGGDVIIAGSVSNDESERDLRRMERAEALHPHRPAAAGRPAEVKPGPRRGFVGPCSITDAIDLLAPPELRLRPRPSLEQVTITLATSQCRRFARGTQRFARPASTAQARRTARRRAPTAVGPGSDRRAIDEWADDTGDRREKAEWTAGGESIRAQPRSPARSAPGTMRSAPSGFEPRTTRPTTPVRT